MRLNKNQLEIPINEYCRILLDSYRSEVDFSCYDYVDKKVSKFFSEVKLRRTPTREDIDYHKMMLANFSKSNDIDGALAYINDLTYYSRDYSYISSRDANGILTELSEENKPDQKYDYVYDRSVPAGSSNKPEYVAYKNYVLSVSTTDSSDATKNEVCVVLELLVELFNLSNLLVLLSYKDLSGDYENLEGIYGQYIGIILMDGNHEFHVELSNYKYNNEFYIDAICSPDTLDPVLQSHGTSNPKVYYLWSYPSNLALRDYQVLSNSCSAYTSYLVAMKSGGLTEVADYSSIQSKWPVSSFNEKHKQIHNGSGDKGKYYKLELLAATDLDSYGYQGYTGGVAPDSNYGFKQGYQTTKVLDFSSLKANITRGIKFWQNPNGYVQHAVYVSSPNCKYHGDQNKNPFVYATTYDQLSTAYSKAQSYLNSLGTKKFNDGNVHINIPDTLRGYTSGGTMIRGSNQADNSTTLSYFRMAELSGDRIMFELLVNGLLLNDPYLRVASADSDTSIVGVWVHDGALKKYSGSATLNKWQGTDYWNASNNTKALYYIKTSKNSSGNWVADNAKWTTFFPFYGGRTAQRNSDYVYYYYHTLGLSPCFSLTSLTGVSNFSSYGSYARACVKDPKIQFTSRSFNDSYSVTWTNSDPEAVNFSGTLTGVEIKKHNLAFLMRTKYTLKTLRPSNTDKTITTKTYYLYTLLFYRNWSSTD